MADGVLEFNNDKGTLSVVESLTQELSELENLVVYRVRQKPRLEACYTWLERNIKNSLIAQDTIKSLISCSLVVDSQVINLRAPRKISAFQCFCGHEKAANLAA